MQAVCGGVDAEVEGNGALFHGLVEILFEGYLSNKTALFEHVKYVHCDFSFMIDIVDYRYLYR